MSSTRAKEVQDIVLKGLAGLFEQVGQDTAWSFAEENGLFDMVITEHTDIGADDDVVLGEYGFIPESENDGEVGLFSVEIVLADALTPEGCAKLYKILNKVNVGTPNGAFIISGDETELSFRDKIAFPKSMEEQELFDYLRAQIMWDLSFVSIWIAPLLYAEAGEITEKDIDELIGQFKNR